MLANSYYWCTMFESNGCFNLMLATRLEKDVQMKFKRFDSAGYIVNWKEKVSIIKRQRALYYCSSRQNSCEVVT